MRTLVLSLFATALLAAAAQAAPPAMTKTTAKAHAPAAPRTAISLDCSKQADAKNMHRKDREKFRKSCMKGK